jgi:hypothetical protein
VGIDASGRAILHNFTHSVILHPDEARQRAQATIASPRWSAPEVYADESPVGPLHTVQSEVYALGNVILEVGYPAPVACAATTHASNRFAWACGRTASISEYTRGCSSATPCLRSWTRRIPASRRTSGRFTQVSGG